MNGLEIFKVDPTYVLMLHHTSMQQHWQLYPYFQSLFHIQLNSLSKSQLFQFLILFLMVNFLQMVVFSTPSTFRPLFLNFQSPFASQPFSLPTNYSSFIIINVGVHFQLNFFSQTVKLLGPFTLPLPNYIKLSSFIALSLPLSCWNECHRGTFLQILK